MLTLLEEAVLGVALIGFPLSFFALEPIARRRGWLCDDECDDL